jgi:UDP-N-acetylmuramoyl-tripeptide--D-alanyl-D-alanine ligase
MNITLKDCISLFPNYRKQTDLHVQINSICTDTRKKMDKGLFIPLVGANFDGHNFLKDAINQGAVATLWQKDIPVPDFIPTQFPLFFVNDTTEALQQLASLNLKKQNPIVIGVTGSNGKTTTKDILSAVLSTKCHTHKTEGNLNNHWGLPFTIFAMPKETKCIVLEMGMNHFGEIETLSNIASPNFAVITNIGESHIENLGSREGIAKAKLEIASGLQNKGYMIVDGDEPLLKNKTSFETLYCGYQKENTYMLQITNASDEGFSFVCNDESYFLPMIGEHNVKNASYAIAVAKRLGLTKEEIQKGFNSIKITSKRLQRFKGKNDALIIDDTYNASPTSMKAAIETLKQLNHYKRKLLVLGDIYELGPDEEQLHRSVAKVINNPITDLITIGSKGKWIADELSKTTDGIRISSFEKKENAVDAITSILSPDTAVLLKASNGLKLEKLVAHLVEPKGGE